MEGPSRQLPTGHHQQNLSAVGSPGDAGVGATDRAHRYTPCTTRRAGYSTAGVENPEWHRGAVPKAGQTAACHLQFFRTGEHLSISSLELGFP